MNPHSAKHAVQILSTELKALGHWWFNELREFGHEIARRLLRGYARRFVIEMQDGDCSLRSIDGPMPATSLRFSLDEHGAFPQWQSLWPQPALENAGVMILLPESAVLVNRLTLPQVHGRDFRSMLELQLERELPIARDEVCVDWKIGERSSGEFKDVIVVAARREMVERLQVCVQNWGGRVTAVGVNAMKGGDTFNLLPEKTSSVHFTVERGDVRLMRLAALLSAFFLLIVAGQWWYERKSLEGPVARAGEHVRAIDAQRKTFSAEAEPIVALRALMQAPSAIEVLSSATAVIPADSWVYQTEINTSDPANPSIRFDGYTPSATVLASALEVSPEFERVELIRAVPAGAEPGMDRAEVKAILTRKQDSQ